MSVAQPEVGSAALESPLLSPWLLLTHECRRHNSAPGNREEADLPTCGNSFNIKYSAGVCCSPATTPPIRGWGAAAAAPMEASLGQPLSGAASRCLSRYHQASLAAAMGCTQWVRPAFPLIFILMCEIWSVCREGRRRVVIRQEQRSWM